MNITMKRQDIIDKLNELMPAFKAEDKRLQAIYKTEFTEYSKLVKQRVRELNKMPINEIIKLIQRQNLNYYIQTGKTTRYNGFDRAEDTFKQHNRLDARGYYGPRSNTPYPPACSWANTAQDYIKHLELASIRSFTLSQDGRYSELYLLVTFEPYTETA